MPRDNPRLKAADKAREADGGARRQARPRRPRPEGGVRAGPGYLRILCASMLRFWLLEHTTATRSGEEGMAAQGRAQLVPRGSQACAAPPAARTKWRPRRGGGRGRDVSAGQCRPAAANRAAGDTARTIERGGVLCQSAANTIERGWGCGARAPPGTELWSGCVQSW